VVELGFPEPATGKRAHALLARAGTDSPELDGTTLRLSTHDGSRLVIDALRALDADGIVPATLVVREPSLDDVFLALTGRHAEPAEAEAEAPA
jgi:hypothetical protein